VIWEDESRGVPWQTSVEVTRPVSVDGLIVLPVSDSIDRVCFVRTEGTTGADATRRSAAGLLTLVENRHSFAGSPSSVEKAVDGSVLAVPRSRP
jgi:hypothetical protein